MKLMIALAAAVLLSGCATRDLRDRSYDPKNGQQLFDQMPNWDGEARRVCGKITTLC